MHDRQENSRSPAQFSRGESSRRAGAEERTGPRRARGGVKLTTSEAALLIDRRSSGWVHLLKRLVEPAAAEEGLRWAEAGQTLSIDARPGGIHADVQGSRRKPLRIHVRIPQWSDRQWKRAIETISSNAAHAASILTEELPEPVVTLLQDEGLRLIPVDPEEVALTVDEHGREGRIAVACAMYLFAQRCLNDSVALFMVRGLQPETVIERLRQQRLIHARGVAAAHPPVTLPRAAEPPMPLEAVVDSFWTAPLEAEPLDEPTPHSRHAAHALLRRMGPSPLKGRFPIVGLLASVYDEVTAALTQRDEERSPPSEP